MATNGTDGMAPATATEAVEAAFRAEGAGDWPRFVSLVHPDALEEFRSTMLEMAGMRDVLAASGHFPGLVLPLPEPETPPVLRAMFGVETVREAEALTGAELFGRYLAGPGGRGRAWDASEPAGRRRVLGVVEQSDGVAHVVFLQRLLRFTMSPGPEDRDGRERARVVTARRVADGSWRVMLNGGLFFDEAGGCSAGWGYGDDEASMSTE